MKKHRLDKSFRVLEFKVTKKTLDGENHSTWFFPQKKGWFLWSYFTDQSEWIYKHSFYKTGCESFSTLKRAIEYIEYDLINNPQISFK